MKNKCICLLWLAVFLFVSTSVVHACLNRIGSNTVSEPIEVSGLEPAELLEELNTRPDKAYWLSVLAQMNVGEGRSYEPTERENNTAVAMLHLGMVGRAIRILEEIERRDPGLYYTAANLGTAYELNGENAKALEWIKKGITRNKDAHNGSEWLHVRILEAKLALEMDPNWLASHSVIGIERVANDQLQPDNLIVPDHLGQPRDINQIEDALVYQLHERLEFIKPPEAVVANLLFDLSRVLSITRGADHGAEVWRFATTYGRDLTPWSLLHLPLPPVPLPPAPSTMPYWAGGGAAVLIAFLVMIIVLRRRRLRAI